jgi:hypothetical protein
MDVSTENRFFREFRNKGIFIKKLKTHQSSTIRIPTSCLRVSTFPHSLRLLSRPESRHFSSVELRCPRPCNSRISYLESCSCRTSSLRIDTLDCEIHTTPSGPSWSKTRPRNEYKDRYSESKTSNVRCPTSFRDTTSTDMRRRSSFQREGRTGVDMYTLCASS